MHQKISTSALLGDAVLIEVSRRLRSLLRRDDTICRQGGDEFILLFPGIKNIADLTMIARKIISKVSEPIRLNSVTCRVGASIGIAIYPHDAEDPERIIQLADRALYRAKQEGRGRFLFSNRIYSTEDLHAGEAQGKTARTILPCFEPIFKTGATVLIGFEVRLIRQPDRMIRRGVEESVNLSELSEEDLSTVYERVFKAYHAWKGARAGELLLLFPFSGNDLTHPRLLSTLQKAAGKEQIPSENIAVVIRNTDPGRTPDPFSGQQP